MGLRTFECSHLGTCSSRGVGTRIVATLHGVEQAFRKLLKKSAPGYWLGRGWMNMIGLRASSDHNGHVPESSCVPRGSPANRDIRTLVQGEGP
jgi:hypothetical protein